MTGFEAYLIAAAAGAATKSKGGRRKRHPLTKPSGWAVLLNPNQPKGNRVR